MSVNTKVIPREKFSCDMGTIASTNTYTDYKHILVYPDGSSKELNIKNGIEEFIKNDNSNLSYTTISKINHDKELVTIYLMPIVNSA